MIKLCHTVKHLTIAVVAKNLANNVIVNIVKMMFAINKIKIVQFAQLDLMKCLKLLREKLFKAKEFATPATQIVKPVSVLALINAFVAVQMVHLIKFMELHV